MAWHVSVSNIYGGDLTDDDRWQNELMIREYLRDRGFTDAAVAGILANCYSESLVNPGQVAGGKPIPEPDDVSYTWALGLIQWVRNGERHPLISYAIEHNTDWFSPNAQMQMISSGSGWMGGPLYPFDFFKTLDDPYRAGYDYCHYRVFGEQEGWEEECEGRGHNAEYIYTQISDVPYLPLPLRIIALIAKQIRKRKKKGR